MICNNAWDGIMLMSESDAIIRGSNICNNSYNGIAVSSNGRVIMEHCGTFLCCCVPYLNLALDITGNAWDGISITNSKCTWRIYDNKIMNNKYFFEFSAHNNFQWLRNLRKQGSR